MKAWTVGPWSFWGTLAVGLVLIGMPQVCVAEEAVSPPPAALRLPSNHPTPMPRLSVDVTSSPQPALHNLVVPAPAASSVTGPSIELYAMADTSVVEVAGARGGGSGFERLRRGLPYGVSHQPVIRYLTDKE